ncbi:hypothetical protein PHYBOEH_004965 [Phytophthora boehmeriae]|uniref:Uncharacterized protein n=1 Tax=Phytophthora boehmeriae TaxID=109152 RepID=A0A8T1WL26_9STRA|nr:hypothetical protein PHYBOEH_004965 [Phytophthora boehmeriae]
MDEVETLKRELEALRAQLEAERKKNNARQDPDTPQRTEAAIQNGKPTPKSQEAYRVSPRKESRLYIHHAAVGSRRGKWWFRERQVLGRSQSDDDCATLKVRETWVWSGRTVILDKIVRVDDHEEPEASGMPQKVEAQDGDAVVKCDVKDSTVGSPRSTPRDPAQPSKDAKTSEAANTTDVAGGTADIEAPELGLQALVTTAEEEIRTPDSVIGT